MAKLNQRYIISHLITKTFEASLFQEVIFHMVLISHHQLELSLVARKFLGEDNHI